MSTAIWYFIDSTGTQVGPVDAAAVRDAIRLHAASPTSLAWREGLSTWVPISQLAAELGLSVASSAPIPSAWTGDHYQPPQHPGSPEAQRGDGAVVPAGFVRRWAALFLDQLVLGVPLFLLMLVVVMAFGSEIANPADNLMFQALFYLAWLVTAPLYYAGMESSEGQATLGKRALGIKVTDMEGRRIGFGYALGRWFAAALSYLTLYIGFLMAAFTDRKRALHDFVAGTQVVDKWAYTSFPERQKQGLSGCLVAFLIMMLMVPVIAILAAISISQYQDYVIRSQVSEASSLADGVKIAVGEYVNNREGWPDSNASTGLAEPREIIGSYVSYVDVGKTPGRIETGFSSQAPQKANVALDGKHLYFDGRLSAGSIEWTCTSDDLKQKWCPSSCTCSG
ncbi:MAG: RDD family protein [Gammaproteobacteria bacterium]|nr:RDD family protein [Gammaproteobacteria bacterium]